MSLGMDPRLIVAHWVDEESRAAEGDAPDARAHQDEDHQAAIVRADAAATDRPSVLRRILSRLRHPAR